MQHVAVLNLDEHRRVLQNVELTEVVRGGEVQGLIVGNDVVLDGRDDRIAVEVIEISTTNRQV